MAYIGKTPVIGNFQVCDAISVVNGQAAYTMQVGGVNVSPESANHMLVSLNGILQAPTSSFTVSGSTITFASNLVTGDVIDFIQILGNVLDLGVPSDNTVTTAKIADGAITSAKLASGTGGKVLQVVTAEYSTQTDSTSATFADTGLTANITPSSTSNKILVIANHTNTRVNGSTQIGLKLFRDATEIRQSLSLGDTNDGSRVHFSVTIVELDSPSSSSEITYKTQFNNKQASGTTSVQMGGSEGASTITLMEIAG